MESTFKLEDFLKEMILGSESKEELTTWQTLYGLNKQNQNYLYVKEDN